MTLLQAAQHCNNILFDCTPQNKTPAEQTENTVCLPPPARLASPRVIKIQFLFLRASCKHKFQMQLTKNTKQAAEKTTKTTATGRETTTTTTPHKIEKLTRFPYILFFNRFFIFSLSSTPKDPQTAVGIFPSSSLSIPFATWAGQLCWPEGAGTGALPTFDELCRENFWRISC